MASRPRSKRAAPATPAEGERFRGQLEQAKAESTLQLLFKAARLLDEQALARARSGDGGVRLRRSHMSLFPHIDLEGTRVTELAQRVGVTKQAVSQLLDDLERAGVVVRMVDPDDARARRVQFTSRGKQGLLDGLSVLRAIETELAQAVGASTMGSLHRALVAILAVAEPSKEEA